MRHRSRSRAPHAPRSAGAPARPAAAPRHAEAPAERRPATTSRRRRHVTRRQPRPEERATPAPMHLTSQPTGRTAYVSTRAWLLAQHGATCAYCGQRVPRDTITLDHVAPRRGQDAFDRRDNLVLSCRPCNAAKRDQPIMAWLLANRDRAPRLLRYGAHLSEGLLGLARDLAGPAAVALAARLAVDPTYPYAD